MITTFFRFVSELLNIAINFKGVSSGTKTLMKKVPCLVGSRRISVKDQGTNKRSAKKSGSTESDDEEEKKLEHELLHPNQVV